LRAIPGPDLTSAQTKYQAIGDHMAQQLWRLKRQSPQNLQASRPVKGHLTQQSFNLSLIDIFFCAAQELVDIQLNYCGAIGEQHQ
jgi:hypothetical protein